MAIHQLQSSASTLFARFDWRNDDDYSDNTGGRNRQPAGVVMIRLQTHRFGLIARTEDAILRFPGGIFGFELSRRWFLLGDRAHGSLYWLQSLDQVDLSLSVVDPREFVSGYCLNLSRAQLDRSWDDREPLVVLCVLTQIVDQLVLNLRNPIVINPALGSGRQVVTSDDQPIQYELPAQVGLSKKVA